MIVIAILKRLMRARFSIYNNLSLSYFTLIILLICTASSFPFEKEFVLIDRRESSKSLTSTFKCNHTHSIHICDN